MDVNLRSLIGKFNQATRNATEAAAGLCLSRTHYNVEIEHYLYKLLETTGQMPIRKDLATTYADYFKSEIPSSASYIAVVTPAGLARLPRLTILLSSPVTSAGPDGTTTPPPSVTLPNSTRKGKRF